MIDHPDIRIHDGLEVASPALFAKLCGVTEAEVIAEMEKHRDALGRYLRFDFPRHWVRGAKGNPGPARHPRRRRPHRGRQPDRPEHVVSTDPVQAAIAEVLFEMPSSELALSGKVSQIAAKAAREACARLILAHADQHIPGGNNAQRRMRRHLRIAASIVNPQPATPAEPKEAA